MIILETVAGFTSNNATNEYVYDAAYEVPPVTTVTSILQLIIDQRRDRNTIQVLALDHCDGYGCSWADIVSHACSAIGQ